MPHIPSTPLTALASKRKNLHHHAPTLPQDLLIDILSRLPVKDLMRMRCVSNTWNSLIFHPTFVKLHLQRSSKRTSDTVLLLIDNIETDMIIFAAHCSTRRLLENPLYSLTDCSLLIDRCYCSYGVCNGLICLYDSLDGNEFVEHCVQFWNPATRIMSKDSSPTLYRSSSIHEFVLFGFGFDDSSDTYKVVMFFINNLNLHWEGRVYCLGDSCWRNVSTCPSFSLPKDTRGKFVSGTLNWIVGLRRLGGAYPTPNVTINGLVIFSYDLKDEKYRYIPMPNGFVERPCLYPSIEVLKGCLSLCHDQRKTHLVVWIMREFGVRKSWTQLLNIRYDQLQILIPSVVIPLCISENEDVMMLYGDSRLILYNRRENRIHRTEDLEDKPSLFIYKYVPSLVLPYRN